MSLFGWGIGDVTTFIGFVFQIGQDCFNAPKEFKQVRQDVRAIHVVLETIRDHWDTIGKDLLPDEHRRALKDHIDQTREPLNDLAALLGKHCDVLTGEMKKRHRLKWVGKNLVGSIASVRDDLKTKSSQLHNFNVTIAQISISTQLTAQGKQADVRHAEIMRALSRLNSSDSLSMPPERLTAGDKAAWAALTRKLEGLNIDPRNVRLERKFIEVWIAHVLPDYTGQSNASRVYEIEDEDEDSEAVWVPQKQIEIPVRSSSNKHANNTKSASGGFLSWLSGSRPAVLVADEVLALFNFEGEESGDLSFRVGDKITVIKRTDNKIDWWEGQTRDGRRGMFPGNYVTDGI